MLVFLRILLNGRDMRLGIPLEKQEKALRLLQDMEGKKKITIKQVQIPTGYLNFLSKAIQAGRTFTRRMYNKTSQLKYGKNGKMLKPYHHVSIDREFRFDCEVWKTFLLHFRDNAVCRPMIDFNRSKIGANQLNFTSDASASETLGFGATFQNQ